MRYTFDKFSCWFYNSIVEPLSRRRDTHKKTHYECCVCGMLESPYFYDEFKGSMRYDYGWHKLDCGKRWICHHCADHGYAPCSNGESTFEEWQEKIVVPQRERVRNLIKAKDPEYYNKCYFYDDEESVERYFSQFEFEDSDE